MTIVGRTDGGDVSAGWVFVVVVATRRARRRLPAAGACCGTRSRPVGGIAAGCVGGYYASRADLGGI